MTAILGVSGLYHDSAAALIVDGRLVAAAQEERFTRRKHDPRLPVEAIGYCLEAGRLPAEQLDYVAFYEKPWLRFDRLLETYVACAPRGLRSFTDSVPGWLHRKLHVARELRRALGGRYGRRLVFAEHHESHAASAFFPSPFDEAAIVTFDGVGEWATATVGYGRGNRVTLTHELRFPHSLGLLYSAFTAFCGFAVNSGEYKLMGLAPYGEPRYERVILDKLLDLKTDGSFRLNMAYFEYCQGRRMFSSRFARLFGGPARSPDAPLTQREMDLAASVQRVTETILLHTVQHVHRTTGLRNLCLAGGVALNCVANGRIVREGPFERVWVQPAAGDAGGAIGAALLVWYQLLEQQRVVEPGDAQQGSRLGPEFTTGQIREFLDGVGAEYRCFDDPDALVRYVGQRLAAQDVVGWFQGRMEFGPRALGGRSILADARSPTMQAILNRKIKFRESFRPFGPIVPRDRAGEFFQLGPMQESPYMLFTFPVRETCRVSPPRGSPPESGVRTGVDRVHEVRSHIPAVTHVDYSARIQTVESDRHDLLAGLLSAFERETGCPILINTSFNVRDEPIVCTPEDGWRCFLATDMDVLVLENCVLLKSEQQPESVTARTPAAARPGTGAAKAVRVMDGDAPDLPRPVGLSTTAQLRTFAGAWLLGLALIAAVVWYRGGPPWLVVTTSLVAGLVPLVGLIIPRALRTVYAAFAGSTWPIGVAVSYGLLAGIYYGLLTPVGAGLRLLRCDPLQRRWDPDAGSYWTPRPDTVNIRQYFRQS